MTFTAADKLRCAEREVAQRKRVYGRLVAEGRMLRDRADREVALMEAIADDYRAQVEAARPTLFGEERNDG